MSKMQDTLARHKTDLRCLRHSPVTLGRNRFGISCLAAHLTANARGAALPLPWHCSLVAGSGPRPSAKDYIGARPNDLLCQHHLPPLDLIESKTNEGLAVRTIHRRHTGNGKPEVRMVTLIAGLLKCDTSCTCWVGAPNRQIPFSRCEIISAGRFDSTSSFG